MKEMKIKKISIYFKNLKIGCTFESLYLEKKQHCPILDLVLNVLLCILDAKKGG